MKLQDLKDMKSQMDSSKIFEITKFNGKTIYNPHTIFFLQRLKEFDIATSIQGDFIDRLTMKKIKKNHLKSMIRRDYMNFYQDNDKLSGTILCDMIEQFLDLIAIATKKVYEEGKHKEKFHEVSKITEFID